MLTITDYQGRLIRLTTERLQHVLEHPEMDGQITLITTTLTEPELVIATMRDSSVHVYHRWFATTPVTSKYLLVTVKILDDDAFLLTAFFSNRSKKGTIIWKR